MGSVYRKQFTKPIPPGAELIDRKGERLARWRDAAGKLRTARVTVGRDGAERLRIESGTYIAKHRDGNGLIVETPTGCRDRDAAKQVLADLERKAERVRAGLLSTTEARAAEHVARPFAEHVAVYLDGLAAAGSVDRHRQNVEACLKRLSEDCGFARLSDLNRDALERWLAVAAKQGRSARTRNAYRAALVAFCNWCVRSGRLVSNPFVGVPKANQAADPRRRRRSMTEDELRRLLDVASRRPLLAAMTVRRGKRKGMISAQLRPETRARLEWLGRERALIYKTMVLTGLRQGELASLTVGHVHLDADRPYLELDAAAEKNREGSSLPLRADLIADIEGWLTDRLERLRGEARASGEPMPAQLPARAPLFDVPDKLIHIFDRDLKAAGIPKRDDRGRTLDVHALRTTFGTLLSKGGVPLRTAQEAMRHSDPRLTACVYTDPALLDVSGALDALPSLPLSPSPGDETERLRATGTETALARLAPPLAPNQCKPGESETTGDNLSMQAPVSPSVLPLAVSPCSGNEKGPLTIAVSGPLEVHPAGLEPATLSSED